MMAMAFTLMRKKAVAYASDETIEQIAKDYESAMKEAAGAISKANKGNKYALGIRRSKASKKKNSEAHKGKKLSEASKKKMSDAKKGNTATKGMHWYNNGKINKLCYECPPGFVPGRIK